MLQSLLPTDSVTWNWLVQVHEYMTIGRTVLVIYLLIGILCELIFIGNCLRLKEYKKHTIVGSIIFFLIISLFINIFGPILLILALCDNYTKEELKKDLIYFYRIELLFFLPVLSLGLLWFI